MAHSSARSTSLGVGRLTLLVTGNIIGSGIFLLPATLGQYGSIGLLAWIYTAIGALILAVVFAELSAVLGSTGGFYSYCREAFGDFVGFQVAYSYWTALWVGNAALVVGLTGYLSLFMPVLAENALLAFLVNISIVWLLTGLAIIWLRGIVLLQMLTTLVKLLPLLAVILIGLFSIKTEHFAVFTLVNSPPITAFNEAATMTLWSFLGLESASLASSYSLNPKRDIPRATVWGVILAATLYILSYLTIIGIMPFSALIQSSAPYADAMQPLLGAWARQTVAVLAIVSCVGSLAGWILLQGQMPLAAAKDHLFPPIFLNENADKVPVAGLLISSGLITGLLALQLNQNLITQFKLIIILATLASLIPYFFTSMAAILLCIKYKERFQSRPASRHLIFMSAVAGLYTFWSMIGAGSTVISYGCLLLFSSFPVYVWLQWRLQNAKLTQ